MRTILLSALLVAGSAMAQQTPAAATDAADAKSPAVSGGGYFIGTRGLDNSGWMGRVGEYEMNKGGVRPTAVWEYWTAKDSWFFDFYGENRGDSRASSYRLEADLNRWVRIRSTLERFMHRLDNDPLTNLDVAKGSVVVRHDELAPNRALTPGRNELNTEITGYINSWLSWRASHRFLQMHGETQTRALSKCANCHAVSESTRINQKMNDVSAGLTAKLGKRVSVHYDFTSRQFKEHGVTPTYQYDVAQHPTTLSRVFFNRVQFDGTTNGEMPYALVPGFRKDTHDVKVNADLPGDSRLAAQVLKTSARNTHVKLDLDVTAWGARYTVPLGERVTLKAHVKNTDMSTDDVFIQLEEPVNPPGVPQAGLTYSQAYPAFGSPDWTRKSSINRSDFVAGAELSAKLAKLTTLRGGWQFRSIERDNYEVKQTNRNRLYALFNTRKARTWNARMRYTFDAIDDPFLHHKAALSPELQPYVSPGTPPSPVGGLQYFTLYAARQADLTNQPTRSQFLEPSFTWTPSAKAALTVHYRASMQDNSKLNYGKWSRDMHMPGTELWVSPLEKLNFTFAYAYEKDMSDTLFVIPVFDG